MSEFNFKNRNLFSGVHLLGILLLVAGLFALVSPLFLSSGSSMTKIISVGTGSCFIGLLIIFTYSGTLIDTSKNRFKEYVSIIGFRMGSWQDLTEIREIKVVSTTRIQRNIPNGISPTLSGKVTEHRILLYSDSDRPVFSFNYSNQTKAIEKARFLADGANSELILDNVSS
ncbi:hypothetical protein [Algoriphagus zhangzhouensis]|uniref:Uncharacterized protein n=1 Tax=Algoriphagus zhangzhouensis TaxID=1073327 RepID=A0A1M7Z3S2_9BACT|nr:hypothetical protein [Algoriphagus zhangzhouensis]TDY48529.1 hypothetical protein A8938_0214 [Algoriphagus zhangzhouensis]SHO59577.1 hypothetical protein SAMN04488108_0215 [Algoriphagus zhangzhouensis]